jgi:anthranilate phosphoribosyltransferase
MKAFRELLKTIGSGIHTGKDLTRQESATATAMMLNAEATPAQIGAFMIAHRIKRPTPEELAGMMDTYNEIGKRFQPVQDPVVVFGNPYDGRTRTAPVTPITALMLSGSGVSVILQGGGRMPTKYGIPLVELWQGLGLDFADCTLSQAQTLFEQTKLGFYYLPQHFPQAQTLVPYRDQIGKRPPLATLELIWSPYAAEAHVVAGFVHPPTEERFQKVFAYLNTTHYTTVKGQEGSCDLPCSRTSIIGLGTPQGFERLHLHPHDFGFAEKDIPLDEDKIIPQLQATLEGKETELTPSAIYNGGFYLWRFGVVADLSAGFKQAETLLSQGKVAQQLERVRRLQIASVQIVD